MIGEQRQDYGWLWFFFQCLCDPHVKTAPRVVSGHRALFGCLINDQALIVDKCNFLDFSSKKESLAGRAKCETVLVAVLLGSTVKFAVLHYYNVVCWHLARRGQPCFPFQNVRTWIVFKWKAHISHRRHVEIQLPWPFVHWWHADCFEWKTADIISYSPIFFHVQYAEKPSSLFE